MFFNKDAQAAAKLGHARGVVLLCCARSGVSVAEYAPARVKRTVAGHGAADKRQVALMVRAVLALDALPPSDAADALALALTHLRQAPLAEAVLKMKARQQLITAWLNPGLSLALQAVRRCPPPAYHLTKP